MRTLSLLAACAVVVLSFIGQGCSKGGAHATPAKTWKIALPESVGDGASFLEAIKASGDEFKAYALANAHDPIQFEDLSVQVINNFKTYQGFRVEQGQGIMGAQTLSDQQCADMTREVTESLTNYLGSKCTVNQTSAKKLVVMLYSDNSMYFDENQNPWVCMGVRVLLLDSNSKQVLWYTDKAYSYGRDAKGAASNAAKNVKEQMETLFNGNIEAGTTSAPAST